MNRFVKSAAFLSAMGVCSLSIAAEPLVDVGWIKDHSCDEGVRVLDIRNPIDGGSRTAYLQGHIPCAVYTDYLKGGWRSEVGGVPGQLSSPDALAKLIGDLGIDNDTHVVVYHHGKNAVDMGSATRMYWTFKVLGHDNVSVLNGGYLAYAVDPNNKIEKGNNKPEPRTFTPSLRAEMVITKEDVKAAIEDDGIVLVDMRPNPPVRRHQPASQVQAQRHHSDRPEPPRELVDGQRRRQCSGPRRSCGNSMPSPTSIPRRTRLRSATPATGRPWGGSSAASCWATATLRSTTGRWWNGARMRACRWTVKSRLNKAIRGVLLCTLAAATPSAAADSVVLRDLLLCPAELLVLHADARRYFRTEPSDPRSRGLHNRISARAGHPAPDMPALRVGVVEAPGRRRPLHRAHQAASGVVRLGRCSPSFSPAWRSLPATRPSIPRTSFSTGKAARTSARPERSIGGFATDVTLPPAPGSENPAEPLHRMARGLPREEFFARMLLGVRGTPGHRTVQSVDGAGDRCHDAVSHRRARAWRSFAGSQSRSRDVMAIK